MRLELARNVRTSWVWVIKAKQFAKAPALRKMALITIFLLTSRLRPVRQTIWRAMASISDNIVKQKWRKMDAAIKHQAQDAVNGLTIVVLTAN